MNWNGKNRPRRIAHEKDMSKSVYLEPKWVRLRDVPAYTGMDLKMFNRLARPHLVEIRLSSKCVAFDKVDLDRWMDEYKSGNGLPPDRKGGKSSWEGKEPRAYTGEAKSGISERPSVDANYWEALERASSMKPKKSLPDP
jgi:hypothetical protein